MQTFLVSPNFSESAAVLDNKRLGKQRVECLQILQTLAKGPYQCKYCKHTPVIIEMNYCPDCKVYNTIRKTPWYNHPAVRMWRGYTDRLVEYSLVICAEWIKRGFTDTCKDKILTILVSASPDSIGMTPIWLGNSDFHASHRSNLLRKDFAHYSQFGWTEPNNLPYIWPV